MEVSVKAFLYNDDSVYNRFDVQFIRNGVEFPDDLRLSLARSILEDVESQEPITSNSMFVEVNHKIEQTSYKSDTILGFYFSHRHLTLLPMYVPYFIRV